MTLTTPEQTLLTNIRIYLTQANSVLSTEGLKSLAKIAQLKDVLVKIVDVSPKYGARLLRGPSQVMYDDDSRRLKEAQKAQREEKQAALKLRRQEEREAVEQRRADRLAKKKLRQTGGMSKSRKRRAEIDETSDDNNDAGHRLGVKRPRTMPSHESDTSSYESEQECPNPGNRNPARDGYRFPRAAHNAVNTDLVNVLKDSRQPNTRALEAEESTSTSLSGSVHDNLNLTRRPSPIELNMEVAIFSQDEATIQQLADDFKTDILPEYIEQINLQKVDNGIKDLFLLCQKLNFDIVKHKLLEFAEQREKKPSSRAQIADLAENAEPTAIFHAIQVSAANEADAKLHRVFGQIQLVKSISRKLGDGYQFKTPWYRRSRDDVSYLLQEMADEVCAGELPETQKRTRARLVREYHAGRHWLKMIKSLGGMGAVLVFIFAEISCNAIANDYNDFQRACLAHIMDKLPSIKALIASIGDHALKDFCRKGQLDIRTMDGIRAINGPEMLFYEDEVSIHSEESEESDAGYAVRRGRHHLKSQKYPLVRSPPYHSTGDEEDEENDEDD
ncbi:MAG: hypothetical protein Q9208_007171 [Pyrenodesmia sp. 3 TL-2023]